MITETKSKRIYNKTPKQYRVLDSTLKIHSSPDRAPYSGPSSFAAICRAIVKDAEDAGIKLSYDFVYRVIRLFFGRILWAMKDSYYISVKGFGEFGMSKDEKRKRLVRDEVMAKRVYMTYVKGKEKA